jgi:hypothetical protein
LVMVMTLFKGMHRPDPSTQLLASGSQSIDA